MRIRKSGPTSDVCFLPPMTVPEQGQSQPRVRGGSCCWSMTARTRVSSTRNTLSFRGSTSRRRATESSRSTRRVRVLPDVIVMDMSLPRLDGREAARQLRADERTRGASRWCWSPATTPTRCPANDGLWDHYLGKPCPPEKLVSVIGRLVAVSATSRSAPSTAGRTPARDPPDALRLRMRGGATITPSRPAAFAA